MKKYSIFKKFGSVELAGMPNPTGSGVITNPHPSPFNPSLSMELCQNVGSSRPSQLEVI